MADADKTTLTGEELTDTTETTTESTDVRPRKLTPKGLSNSIATSLKNLGAIWKRTSAIIKSIDETSRPNDELSLRQVATELSDGLTDYTDGWTVLDVLFQSDSEGEFIESYRSNDATFNTNVAIIKDAITKVSAMLAKLQDESKSVKSQKTHRSLLSTSSRASIVSLRAKAAAEAAAAKEKLRYAKEIATLKSKAAVKMAKEEAEFNAQLEILKAEQEAAETAARVEALSDIDDGSLSNRSSCDLTSQKDTADDHVQRFLKSLPPEPETEPEPPKNDPKAETPAVHHPTPAAETARIVADAVTTAVNLKQITPPEPAVFSGDPLKYPDWKISFDCLIEGRVLAGDRIHYLKRYLSGGAKEAVSGYFLLKDPSAYQKAMDVLEDRYGSPYMVAEALRTKLADWPRIDPKDYEEVRRFSDFLTQCSVAMKEMSSLGILNDTREISNILEKLPSWITNRWKRTAVTSKRATGKYPGLSKLADFMKTECDILCDPAMRPSRDTKKQTDSATKPRAANVRSMATNAEKAFCVNCEKPNHSLSECRKFGSRSDEEKEEFIKKNGLCYGCLRKGHRSKDCQSRATCERCKLNHPTSLHRERPVGEGTNSHQMLLDTTSRAVDTGMCGNVSTCEMTSMIVPVWVSSKDHPSDELLTYAILDTQSDSTFVTNNVAGKLRAKPTKSTLRLTTMTAERKIIRYDKHTTLQVRRFDGDERIDLPNTFTRESIPATRSHIGTSKTASSYSHLKPIAHLVPPLQDCGFGLLIGYNCSEALAPIKYINGGDKLPYAIETKLGWSIVGTHRGKGTQNEDEIGVSHRIVASELSPPLQHINKGSSTHQYVMRTKVKELGPGDAIKALERDFDQVESSGHPYSVEDQRFLDLQSEAIHVNADHHIEMPLPFRSRPRLPNNKSMAMHRLKHLKKKLTNDDRYYLHYKKFMEDIIRNGDAEKVLRDDGMDGGCWYIPHHGVYHPNKPDKIRVVFDCSAKFQNTSLNDHLLTGPDLTNNLVGVLCRFRQGGIAIMCDIERMFHQFHVNPEDRDYLRFLWWPNGDLNAEPSTYRMKVHLFGAGSSPGCANFGLKHIVDLYANSDQQEAKKFIKKNFYVDDGLTSVDEPSDAIKIVRDATSICADGSLRLHKFVSSSKAVMATIPEPEQAQRVKDVSMMPENLPIERALGIQWCVELDSIQFRVVVKDHPLTRRGILSTVASVFDPLGFLAPFTLKGKQILQEMCKEGADWDEALSDELRPRWERWLSELPALANIQLSRCYKPEHFGRIETVELHHFSDASTVGYGESTYIRLVGEREVHSTLVMGKSRVTPLKTVTVPRLELQAAVVSTQVSNILNNELDYEKITNHFWTDSQVVLGYIRNDSKRFHVYVANRVQQIRNHTEPNQWNYVRTETNPADHASRGLFVEDMASSNWFTGPSFLLQREIEYIPGDVDVLPDDPEVKSGYVCAVASEPINPILQRIEHFSDWTKAVKGITALRRHVLQRRRPTPTSRVEELKETEKFILRQLQQHHFQNEIKCINQGKPGERGNLWKLSPYIDQEGLLRIGGRLGRSDMSQESKHQVLIPRKSHITSLLTKHFHERVAHQGRGMTTNAIRSNGFWIIGLSSAVSTHIYRCITCRKLRGKTNTQRMSDLPKERVQPSPPFAYCGVDCFGPFITKEGRKEIKKYGLLITCMSSRAIHLEMLDDLTTDAFINSMRCVMAIRGRIRQIFCDRGTNFVGARNELTRNLAAMLDSRTKQFLEDRHCEFVLNVPSSSHMGGVWERQIRTVRSVLEAILQQHQARLDGSSLRTFLYEAMAIVNSRPLTVENINDPNGPEPLTPNHLLFAKSELTLPPAGEFVRQDLYTRKRWKQVQFLANEFWTRWRKEYLQALQSRAKWNTVKRNMEIGDVVILKEGSMLRGNMTLARVVETIPSLDGAVRKVKLLLADSELNKMGQRVKAPVFVERPIHKLVLLQENE